MSAADTASAVPPQSRGSWSSFLKSVASFSGDLSSMTAPPFILSSTSLTEFSSYWADHPHLFVAPASAQDPAERALLVLKWFLSTLKQQYASRSEKLGSEKKPLNPFLGELFLGKWEDDAGTTQLISEQVSHHPPVTAYTIWNDQHGVRLSGYYGQKASFSRTLSVKQVGHALLHLDAFDEDYLITLPSLHIEGLITGSPYVELNSKSYIASSSGYTAKIDYSGKGWLSGKRNSFVATLYPSDKTEKDAVYTIDGQWTDQFTIRKGNYKSKDVVDTYDAKSDKSMPVSVAPVEQQGELESRRAWQRVAQAVARGDMDATGREKALIENQQRELRRKEREDGRDWERRYFKKAEQWPVFEKLAKVIDEPVEADKTNGVWNFDGAKFEQSGATPRNWADCGARRPDEQPLAEGNVNGNVNGHGNGAAATKNGA